MHIAEKEEGGSMEFCCLKPEGLIARVGLLERGSGVELRLLKDFSVLLSSSGSLFCYVIEHKQLLGGQKLHEWGGGYQLWHGVQPP